MNPRTRLALLAAGLCLSMASISPLQAANAERTYRLNPTEASDHAGQMAIVCGVVASAKYAQSTSGSPTFLNLDRPYPDHIFTVLIWGTHRSAFGTPERAFEGKRVCVSGRIEMYKGRPEIVAKVPSQLWLDGSK